MTTDSAVDWRRRAEATELPSRAFIDGGWADAAGGATMACITPIAGQALCEVASCDAEDVDRAVAAARRSFDGGGWSAAAPRERKQVLHRLAELVEANADQLADLIALDAGHPLGDARFEVGLAVDQFRFFAEAVDKVYGEVVPTASTAYATVTREPLGVVAAIVPWNYPLLMPVWKVAPALAAGNSVVVKPAEQAPLVALRLAALAAEAGLPDGVLSVVPGTGEVAGQALARHRSVNKIAFTGSTEVGKLMLRYASESNLKSVSLECGGKSPNVVLGDVPDLDVAASMTAEAIFGNAGQVCNASSRLIVHEDVAEELVARIVEHAASWQPGDPFDPATQMGPLIDEAQLRRVLAYVDAGREEGATLAAGGTRVREDTGGYYVEPTVFTAVSNDMRIAREEIFGPVLSAITFRTEEEAIRIANDTPYGLAGAIWTRDLAKAHRFSRELRAGNVYVNCFDRGDLSLPFGGYGDSGFGRDKSLHALDGYTQLKSTFMNLGA